MFSFHITHSHKSQQLPSHNSDLQVADTSDIWWEAVTYPLARVRDLLPTCPISTMISLQVVPWLWRRLSVHLDQPQWRSYTHRRPQISHSSLVWTPVIMFSFSLVEHILHHLGAQPFTFTEGKWRVKRQRSGGKGRRNRGEGRRSWMGYMQALHYHSFVYINLLLITDLALTHWLPFPPTCLWREMGWEYQTSLPEGTGHSNHWPLQLHTPVREIKSFFLLHRRWCDDIMSEEGEEETHCVVVSPCIFVASSATHSPTYRAGQHVITHQYCMRPQSLSNTFCQVPTVRHTRIEMLHAQMQCTHSPIQFPDSPDLVFHSWSTNKCSVDITSAWLLLIPN